MSEFGHACRRTTGVALASVVALVASTAPVQAPAQTTPLVLQSISAGMSHACGITANHVAYCWGRNAEGELGNTSVTANCSDAGVPCSVKPVRVEGGLAFSSVSAGNNFTCGITTVGTAYCWGAGAQGQLGTGSQASSGRPQRVVTEGVAFQSISAGNSHACAVSTTGAAYCWGSNAGGRLGTGSLTGGRTAPTPVTGQLQFRSISAGYYHTCGVARSGATYCWGRNEQGELGNGATVARGTPVRVAADMAGRLVHAAGQFDYSCVINRDGSLFCFGANCYGQLGVDSTTEQCGTPAMPCSSTPKAVHSTAAYQSVSAYFSHVCALTADGAVHCWGENNQGQLGNGHGDGSTSTPTPIVGGASYKAVSVGRQFSCAITADGVPQCWGRNAEGQLGAGDADNRESPTPVAQP